jgi:hypothetical protein
LQHPTRLVVEQLATRVPPSVEQVELESPLMHTEVLWQKPVPPPLLLPLEPPLPPPLPPPLELLLQVWPPELHWLVQALQLLF